jgi:hypothetical protein
MSDPVMIALKRRLAQADEIDVSRYQFVNMEAVRQAAGELWPGLRERVFVATRSIIERRIAEDDLIIPCATGYLVVFTALSGEPAARLTRKISEEMERFFLGDGELSELGVSAASERQSVEQFRAALAAADVDADPEGEALASSPPEPGGAIELASLRYHAAWDTRREAVASFMVHPRTTSERDSGWRPDLGAQLARPDDRLAFDLSVLEQAARTLAQLQRSGVRCGLITPAGFASLSHPRTRSSYVTALSALPTDIRQLIWTCIEGAPADAPSATLAETGRIVGARSAQLFLTSPIGASSLERYAQTGAGWIGAALKDSSAAALRSDLERFMAKARRRRMKVFFTGCHDWETVRTSSRLGADLIIGKAVGAFDAPVAPFRLSRARLLSRAA